jgi:hypothetical protein
MPLNHPKLLLLSAPDIATDNSCRALFAKKYLLRGGVVLIVDYSKTMSCYLLAD